MTKVLRGWGHEVFNAGGPSAVILRTPGAIVDKSAYTIANPVTKPGQSRWPFTAPQATRVEDMGSCGGS